MRRFRSERTVWQRAVLTVLAAYALIIQAYWAGVMPLRMASGDHMRPAHHAVMAQEDGDHGGAHDGHGTVAQSLLCHGMEAPPPAEPHTPAGKHANLCCTLFCRGGFVGGDPFILPDLPSLRVPVGTRDRTAPPRVETLAWIPLKTSGGARAPPVLA